MLNEIKRLGKRRDMIVNGLFYALLLARLKMDKSSLKKLRLYLKQNYVQKIMLLLKCLNFC